VVTALSFAGQPPVLVGRDRELALLHGHFTAALHGRGNLVLVGGEAGIGKTAVAETLCQEAREQGTLVLVGRCYDLTETPPYGPWVELFAHYRPTDNLPPPPAPFAERGTVGAVASQAALFNAVLGFLTALTTERPLVLLLEDVHWQDPASLDLLRFLAREVSALPALMIVTYRADELTRHRPLHHLLPTLVRESHAARIDLRPLDDDAIRTLVDARFSLPTPDAERLTRFVQQRAEGNALFIGELLRSLVESGVLRDEGGRWSLTALAHVALPPLLRQVIDARVTRLDTDGQRVLAVAAVVGHEVALVLWALAAEVDEAFLLGLIEAATTANLLVETSDGLRVRFAHALVREAVYEGISPARRRVLHQRIAELLVEQPHPDPDVVALHFQQASDARAVPWLVKAGERAQLAYAWLTAIERYEAALALLDGSDGDPGERGWLRYRIARLRRYRTPLQSVAYLDEALRIADAIGDPALAAAARYTRGLCLYYVNDYARAIDDMTAGADALDALGRDEQARLSLDPDAQGIPTVTNPRGFLVVVLALSGRIAEALAMGEGIREGLPRHTPLGELGWAHYGDRQCGLGIAYALAGRPAEARAAFAQARACYRGRGNHATLGAAVTWELIFVSLPYDGDQPDDRRRLDEAAMEARERAGETTVTFEHLAHLPLLALAGRWTEAQSKAEKAVQAGVMGMSWRDDIVRVRCELARAQGEPSSAWTFIRALLPSGPESPAGTLTLSGGLALIRIAAMLCLDSGDLSGARAWLAAHDHWLAWSGAVLGHSEGQALWTRYYRQTGDAQQAQLHAEHALAHASDPRQPLALLAAHRLLGELDTDAGRYEDAARHLETSLNLAAACQATYERALTFLAQAELRAASGSTEDALKLLHEVKAICEPLGARPALEGADALATRLTSAPTATPAYPAGLSAREVEVLRLVAQGLTNPQVAERLFLSPRTVEQHLRSIYNKLDVSTRAAATAFAVSHDLA
jgi:DNA-binding CsgD family transcriptional regulator/tetratricopeptide (TPR) repeat protein